MMMIYLAEVAAAEPDALISGDWLLKVIPVLAAAVALILGKNHWKKQGAAEATNNITVQGPVPEVPFRKVDRPVSFDQHNSLEQRVGRIETHLDVIQRDQASQYRQILEAGSERELRMTEAINNGLREVHHRLDGIIVKPAPRTRS